MINMFILDEDYEKSAMAMCDQHVLKIPMEVVQAAVVVATEIDPSVLEKIRVYGVVLPKSNKGVSVQHMHPLPRWMALCSGNYMEILHRAEAITNEYFNRYRKHHPSAGHLAWLICNPLDFNTTRWLCWVVRERKGLNSKGRPYAEWFDAYAYYIDIEKLIYVWEDAYRNDGGCTYFAQIMDDEAFPGCRTPHDAVSAGRKHYAMKSGGTINGLRSTSVMKQPMRYFYCPPPEWLVAAGGNIQYTPKTKRSRQKNKADILPCKKQLLENSVIKVF